MIEDTDYCYIFPTEDKESVHIKFLEGPYADTVFKYGKVKVEEKNDEAYLHFDFDVIESSVMKPRKLEKTEDFKNYIGNFLVEIMLKKLEQQDIIDESGTTDTEESDL